HDNYIETNLPIYFTTKKRVFKTNKYKKLPKISLEKKLIREIEINL
ncbi:821_t:CDS:1, partial [Racocetra fulgida]